MITTINEFKKFLNEEFEYKKFNISILFNEFVERDDIDNMFLGYDYEYFPQVKELEFYNITDPDMDTVYDKLDELVGEDNYTPTYDYDGELSPIEEALNFDEDEDINLSKELKDKLYIGDFH